ncbi:MAG: endolytic transglycosylase MltG [Gammaproteobacteria bacterium]|nr:endolytic transglycosylase MltG [Gammaproteobacteria bacterium]
MRRMIRSLLIAGILVAAAAAASAAWWFNASLDAPLELPDSGYKLEVRRGSSLTSVATELAAAGVLTQPRVLSWHGRLTGEAGRVQAGEYRLEPGVTARSLLQQLVSGQVVLHTLTILEGWTVRELLVALAEHQAIEQTLSVESPEELAQALGLEMSHAEGWFFPDTYRFPRGTKDTEVLMLAHELMRERLADAWAMRAPDTNLADPYAALILASIVERESALDSERPQVAGVFTRRLERGMRLQTDPTVIYGLGTDFDGNLTRRHLTTDTPYNTYTRKGLPPTPIALPGEGALHAAVNPDDSSTLYFVATGRDDGSHVFTETLEEHNAAVAQYLAELRRRKNN